MSARTRLASISGRLGRQGGRVLLLLALLVASGVAIGLAASFPLQYVNFEESGAVRIDQARLAGEVDPELALVAAGDLSAGWVGADEGISVFGILGTEFCGEKVDLPTPLSETTAAVFTNDTDETTVISQALRVDRWQSAREYVSDVERALAECDEFFQVAPGARVKVHIKEASGSPPITDYVSAAFVSDDGQSVQEWSIMAVGDVVIAISHLGPTRPPAAFLNDVEKKVLARVDPDDFAPGGIAPDALPDDVDTSTTAVDSSPADETEVGDQVPDPSTTEAEG